ncbi:MAG: hypothetical protein JSV30_02250 [Candidatus Omnitrophota bacterium]|nr:MAG: hypothetical protein JSV30_02250 [Candidatus Omnitrophota bacterium]
MLSDKEKREIFEDAASAKRKANFRFAKRKVVHRVSSLDEYILFLNSIQKIFTAFKISRQPVSTNRNKL